MPLTYTVIEEHEDGKELTQTFEGFSVCVATRWETNFCRMKGRPAEAKYLGIVVWEDTVTLYWLENKELAVEELRRMWRMNPGIEIEVHVFQQV